MTLGERIIKLRNSKGISQDTLAVALGVSRQSVSKWETDASVPELDKLIKLSEYFEVSLDELIKGEAYSSEPIPSALNQWWLRIDNWYREKAYLLGYVFVVWGLWGLIRIVLSVIAFCFKTWSTGGALALFGAMLSAIIEHSLKIILGYHIVNHGKKRQGHIRGTNWVGAQFCSACLGIAESRCLASDCSILFFLFRLQFSRRAKRKYGYSLWKQFLITRGVSFWAYSESAAL